MYILLLEAVIVSLDKFTKWAMFVGEMPILRRRHITTLLLYKRFS